MTIYSVAWGTVVSAPARVSTGPGTAAVLVLRDTRADRPDVEYEVYCQDAELGGQILDRVKTGDALVVVGTLKLDALAGPFENSLSAARLTLLGETVGLDLAAATERVPRGRTWMNLRLIVDSQQRLSRRLARMVERTDAGRAETWRARAASYVVLKQHLRNVGGRIGNGGPAVAEASNAVSQLQAVPADAIVEPRVAAGFQTLFDGIDQRVAEIIDTGIDRGAYFERRRVPRLVTGAGQLVSPVRERFVPLDRGVNKELLDAVRELIPRGPTEPVAPGLSRSILHSALIHRPTRGSVPDGPHI